MRDDTEAVPGVPVGEMPVAWTLFVVGCTIGALLTGEFSRLTLRLAAPFLLAGGLLALAAVRALGRGRRLVAHGPYRWVRHPYFLGVILMLVGAIVAMRSLPALVLLVPTLRVTLGRARREEHNLALRFGEPYATYRSRVPAFFPLRPPLPARQVSAVEGAGADETGSSEEDPAARPPASPAG